MQIVSFVISVGFGFILLKIGQKMLSIKSFDAELKGYEKSRHQPVFQRWFFFWENDTQRKLMRAQIDTIGDKWLTRFYHVSAAFFILVAFFSVVGSILLLRL